MIHLLPSTRPALVLAPMQDVTDLPFMRVLARRGAPDWFVTEYFRVHPESRLDSYILRSITENETKRPIFAQMIGREIKDLVRTAKELENYPIEGIDLNLGCPAPVVCRKEAGGGLLRNLDKVNEIIGVLREKISRRFTVKTRLGYYDPDEFHQILAIFQRHQIDGLSIHGRTVMDRYQTEVRPNFVKLAAQTLSCPVIANGNIVDLETALAYQKLSQAAGLMIGRGAIRNPWIFSQIESFYTQTPIFRPKRKDLLEYISELSEELAREAENFHPLLHIQRMKKTLIYICEGIDQDFERQIRRMKTPAEFDQLCQIYLNNETLLEERPPNNSRIFCGFDKLLAPFGSASS